jgi:phosphatidylcholine synthase
MRVRVAAAWGVHLFTASGAVLALLALDAVIRNAFRDALLWLLVALVVDGVDGTLARRLRVAERVPRIDGAALDLVVDYLTYVLVPVLIMWRGEFLPSPLTLPLASAILLSSLYVFVRSDMKTDDGYFRGFPALWNVVAAYFVLVPPTQWLAAVIVIVLIVLTFAPVHVVHPFRATDSPLAAPVTAMVWLVATTALALADKAQPLRSVAALASLATLTMLAAIGFRRTWRGER